MGGVVGELLDRDRPLIWVEGNSEVSPGGLHNRCLAGDVYSSAVSMKRGVIDYSPEGPLLLQTVTIIGRVGEKAFMRSKPCAGWRPPP